MRVEVAFAVPLSAAIWTTYSPGAENRAVVTGAFGSANVTVPGPDTRLQATAGAGITTRSGPAIEGGRGERLRRQHPVAAQRELDERRGHHHGGRLPRRLQQLTSGQELLSVWLMNHLAESEPDKGASA